MRRTGEATVRCLVVVTWIQLHQKSFGGDYRGVGKIYIKVVDKFQSVPMKKASMSNVTIRNNKKTASLKRPAGRVRSSKAAISAVVAEPECWFPEERSY